MQHSDIYNELKVRRIIHWLERNFIYIVWVLVMACLLTLVNFVTGAN